MPILGPADRPGGQVADLDARYGRSRFWTRPTLIVVAALLALAGLGWVAWAGLVQAYPPVNAELRSYVVQGPHRVQVTVALDRRHGDAVTCEVYAQADDHSTVGERTIAIAAGDPGSMTVTTTIVTQRPAVNGVLRSCSVAD
ncbi:MAG: DUF4307 domain-containing protein [Nocardioidaceae bacterium]